MRCFIDLVNYRITVSYAVITIQSFRLGNFTSFLWKIVHPFLSSSHGQCEFALQKQ